MAENIDTIWWWRLRDLHVKATSLDRRVTALEASKPTASSTTTDRMTRWTRIFGLALAAGKALQALIWLIPIVISAFLATLKWVLPLLSRFAQALG